MPPIPQPVRRRLLATNVICVLLWVMEVVLLLFGAPFWLLIVVAIAATYFAVLDWREIRARAKAQFNPPHPDADVQDLIDGKIEISEYIKRKEAQL